MSDHQGLVPPLQPPHFEGKTREEIREERQNVRELGSRGQAFRFPKACPRDYLLKLGILNIHMSNIQYQLLTNSLINPCCITLSFFFVSLLRVCDWWATWEGMFPLKCWERNAAYAVFPALSNFDIFSKCVWAGGKKCEDTKGSTLRRPRADQGSGPLGIREMDLLCAHLCHHLSSCIWKKQTHVLDRHFLHSNGTSLASTANIRLTKLDRSCGWRK